MRYQRGRNPSSNMKPWRVHKSISPRPCFSHIDERPNGKRHTSTSLKGHECSHLLIDDLFDRLSRASDSSQERKHGHKITNTPVFSPTSSTRDDNTDEEYHPLALFRCKSPSSQEKASHESSLGQWNCVASRTNEEYNEKGLESCNTSHHSSRDKSLEVFQPLSKSVETEYDKLLTEDDDQLLQQLKDIHQQEIIELKSDHQHFIEKLRCSYQQREKDQELVLRKLDHDIKKMRHDMDLLKLSSLQSLDSVRQSIESNCKALQFYVDKEIAESKQQHDAVNDDDAPGTLYCVSNRRPLQNDDTARYEREADAKQSPVPTLQSWNEFTQRFRRVISGTNKLIVRGQEEENEWRKDNAAAINATRFIEEMSFETYFDAEC